MVNHSPLSSWHSFRKVWATVVAFSLITLTGQPALAGTLKATPSCGVVGTKVRLTGSGWEEPVPVCTYKAFFDGEGPLETQPDGLFGPPNMCITVPQRDPDNYNILVNLDLDSNNQTVDTGSTPFKVVAAARASSVEATPVDGDGVGAADDAIRLKFKPGCELSCKKIVFIQTVRRFAVKDNPTMDEVITKATDWPGLPHADKKVTVETDPDRRRVDMDWGLQSPYYNQDGGGNVPEAGNTADYGQVGSDGANPNDAGLFDRPDTRSVPADIDGVPIKKVILRFESAPFCVEGDDAGKFLGHVVTWEHHQDKGATGKVQNIATAADQPSAEFLDALNKWVDKKYAGKLPEPKPGPAPCP
jgi:hypothetical protein